MLTHNELECNVPYKSRQFKTLIWTRSQRFLIRYHHVGSAFVIHDVFKDRWIDAGYSWLTDFWRRREEATVLNSTGGFLNSTSVQAPPSF